MRIASLRLPLSLERVRKTPDMQGVYTLWDGDECLYIGHTPWNRTLQACLRQLLELRDQGVIRATHYTWETTATPKSREYQLLARSVERQGRLPRYNKAGSPLRAVTGSVTDLRAR
jgi:hypothetical protein